MHELTFTTQLIFLTRSSHSHSLQVNQQYIDNVMQQLIMQHIVSHQWMPCIIQSLDNMTDFRCLLLSPVFHSPVFGR